MNLSKKKIRLLLALADESDYINSKNLAFNVGVSVRTIKSYIKDINHLIEDFDVRIESKMGKGYKLIAGDSDKLSSLLEHLISGNLNVLSIDSSSQRIDYIIRKLLLSKEAISLDTFLNELFISIHTLHKDMLSVKNRFAFFRIKLNFKEDHFYLSGSEMDFRLCINEYLYHNNNDFMFSEYKSSEDGIIYREILKILNEILEEKKVMIAPYTLENFANHIYIGLERFKKGELIEPKIYENRWKLLNDDSSISLANELSFKIYKKFGIRLNYNEKMYYALHFKCKILNCENVGVDRDKSVECVEAILREIKNNFDLDFSEDTELYQYLVMHIPLMIVRINAHIVMRNPLVVDNLRRYLFATKITHSAARVIKEHYGVDIDVNEFGYLTLYFQVALVKKERDISYNIGLFFTLGRPEQILYLNEIYHHFGGGKYKFIELGNDFMYNNDKYDDIDFLITTDTVKKDFGIHKYVIREDDYISDIRKELESIPYRNFSFDSYFKKDNFIVGMSAQNKEELLNMVFKYLQDHNYLKNKYVSKNSFDSIFLGKGILHLQDTDKLISRTICLFIVLEESIYWNQNSVRIVILTKTKRDTDKDLYLLCNIISNWASENSNIIRLIENNDFDMFIEDLKAEYII